MTLEEFLGLPCASRKHGLDEKHAFKAQADANAPWLTSMNGGRTRGTSPGCAAWSIAAVYVVEKGTERHGVWAISATCERSGAVVLGLRGAVG